MGGKQGRKEHWQASFRWPGKVAARSVYFKSRHLYAKISQESVVGSRCWHNRLILFYFVCWYLLITVTTGNYPHCNFKLTNVHLSCVCDLVSPCEQQWGWPCKWAKTWAVLLLLVRGLPWGDRIWDSLPKPLTFLDFSLKQIKSESVLFVFFPPLRSVWPSEGGAMPKVMSWKNRNESLVSNPEFLHDSRLEKIFFLSFSYKHKYTLFSSHNW